MNTDRNKALLPSKKRANQKTYKVKSLFKHGLEWLKNVLVNSKLKKKEFSVLMKLLRCSFQKIRLNCVVE